MVGGGGGGVVGGGAGGSGGGGGGGATVVAGAAVVVVVVVELEVGVDDVVVDRWPSSAVDGAASAEVSTESRPTATAPRTARRDERGEAAECDREPRPSRRSWRRGWGWRVPWRGHRSPQLFGRVPLAVRRPGPMRRSTVDRSPPEAPPAADPDLATHGERSGTRRRWAGEDQQRCRASVHTGQCRSEPGVQWGSRPFHATRRWTVDASGATGTAGPKGSDHG